MMKSLDPSSNVDIHKQWIRTPKWWEQSVVYEIAVMSFQETDGDETLAAKTLDKFRQAP
jgi:hypothetical protein